MRIRVWIAMLIATGAIAPLTGCGGSARSASAPDRPNRVQSATLVLDFIPNAVHAGIYSALAHGYDAQEGVRLHVIAPSASTDSIKLLETGRAGFAILDIHDLAIARERGEDIVGIMAVVQRPLAAVLTAPPITSPRELAAVGRTVGITGVPSDTAVLRSIVAGAGGDPGRLKTVTIGFNAVAALLAHRVAGATAFWNDEGVSLQRERPGFHVFRVDDYGAPSYPELVLCASHASLQRDPQRAHAVVRALTRGYGVTLSDPRRSEADLEREVPGLDPRLLTAELRALLPVFGAGKHSFGTLDLTRLRAWSTWEARMGIVSRPPDVSRMFDPRFAAGT
ncbi:MAG: ABC transporter substrate-binding protein [Solirubrobacteraceae bacterium]